MLKHDSSVFMLSALLLTLALFAPLTHAKTASYGPVFKEYGAVYDITDMNVPLKKDIQYKVLFDIGKRGDDEAKMNRAYDSIARFINMHVRHGVKLENIDIAVVLHGKATKDGMKHQVYEARYLTKNPSLDIINQLSAKGVKFYQCGQSAYYNNIKTKDLSPNVGMALSAMTMLTELQADGYSIIPWW